MTLNQITKIKGLGIHTQANIVSNSISLGGIATASNFKTGTTNVHNVGVEAAGINVLGADTPIGTGATIYDAGGAVFTGVVTATSFSGTLTGNVAGDATGLTGTPDITVRNITGVGATFTGNVSIGGTLTYEDVTNVDAVGLVTARTGVVSPYADIDDWIDVGNNIQLGNAGVITATSFSGSGANLTGIDATALKDSGGNVKIQAQASGAMHTGVTTITDEVVTSKNLLTLKGTSWGDGEKVFTTYKRGAVDLGRVGVEADGAGQAGQLIFECGYGGSPVERVRITSAGLVGINCTPNKQLEVKGTDVAFRLLSTVATGRIGMEFYDTSAQKGYFGYPSSGNDNMSIQQNEDADLYFYVNGGTRLNIKSTGQVRIDGPTAAAHGLRFTPNGWNGYDNRMGYCGTSGADFWWSSNWNPTDGARDHSGYATNYIRHNISNGYLSFGTGAVNASASERLRITSDGKVSIGGFTPAVAGLSIANSSTSLGFEFDTGSGFASGPTIRGYHRPSSAYKQLGITGADIRFGINDVEKMRLDSGGKLLLGDTNTAWNATSNGYKMTIKESSSENAAILFMDTDSMAGGVAGISKGTNQILSGTTNVDFVVGSLYADTHIIYGVGSDQNGRIGATINTSGQFLVGTTTASDSGNKFESHSSTGYNIVAKSTNGNGGFHNFTGRASNNTITSYISHNGRGYFEDGVQFDSSGESLRSYEEGTFTPSYRSSSNPTVGYQNQDGIYRKIGNIVYYQIYIRINSKSGGSGNLYIDNLPFTAHGTGYGGAGGILYVNAWGGNAPTNLMVGSGSTILYLYGGGLSGGTSLNLYPSDIGTSSQLRINGTYLAA